MIPRLIRLRPRRGVAFILALFFLVIFASLATAVVATTESNLVIARNRTNSEQSHAIADGGLCLTLKTLAGTAVTGAADAAALHQAIGTKLKTALAMSSMLNAANITWNAASVRLPTAVVSRADGTAGQCDITLTANGGAASGTTITVLSVGRFNGASRAITYKLTVQGGGGSSTVAGLINNYGIASKGPISFTGNASISGANTSSEGSILSCTTATNAVSLTGNSRISGDIVVTNSSGKIKRTGNSSIGGDQSIGQMGAPAFPTVDISAFTPYASNTRSSGASGNITLSNIVIPPNSNPTFSGNTTINGVIYVQSPNKVSFTGNVTLTGVIVCDTPVVSDLDANQIKFTGNIQTYGVENLPTGSVYDGLRNQTGSFLLAPGYAVSFTGNSSVVNGCMVGSQFSFTGNSGGRIKGGILCLEDNPFTVTGNAPLIIDKSGASSTPSGVIGGGGAATLACKAGSYAQ
jgi:hypothetical protein